MLCLLRLIRFHSNFLITEKNFSSKNKIKTNDYISIFRNRSILVSSGLALVLALMNGGIFTFLPILAQSQFEINVGLLFMINAISLILFRLLTSHLSDRYGRGPCAFYSFLIICLSYYLIGHSQTV